MELVGTWFPAPVTMRNNVLLVAQDIPHKVLVLRLLPFVSIVQELLSLSANDRRPVLNNYLHLPFIATR